MAWPGREGSGRSVRVLGRPGPGSGPRPGSGSPQGPREGRPGAPLSPCCPARLPRPTAACSSGSSGSSARGPPGPREGRDDPCWPEQWRLRSPAPPRRSAVCPPGLGAPREFVGDLEEQPECEALPGCGNQASALSALPLLGTRRPHSGRPPSRGASRCPRPRLLKPVPPEGAWHQRGATGLR